MNPPRTPSNQRLAPTGEAKSRMLMAPNSRPWSLNNVDGKGRRTAVIRGGSAMQAARRAWRLAGDRKTMFDGRGERNTCSSLSISPVCSIVRHQRTVKLAPSNRPRFPADICLDLETTCSGILYNGTRRLRSHRELSISPAIQPRTKSSST